MEHNVNLVNFSFRTTYAVEHFHRTYSLQVVPTYYKLGNHNMVLQDTQAEMMKKIDQ